MKNYYVGTNGVPHHLSTGAVVLNTKGDIACHHVTEFDHQKVDAYILMRETVEIGENLECAVARGLQEEMGIEAEVITYLGSTTANFSSELWHGIQKTTLYFLLRSKSFDLSRRDTSEREPEGQTKIEWHSPEFLIKKMATQNTEYNRPDLDESEVVIRALDFLKGGSKMF